MSAAAYRMDGLSTGSRATQGRPVGTCRPLAGSSRQSTCIKSETQLCIAVGDRDMLVDEHNRDILPLGVLLEYRFNRRYLCLCHRFSVRELREEYEHVLESTIKKFFF